MAIGRTSNQGVVDRVQTTVAASLQVDQHSATGNSENNNNDLAICNFKMGCQEIIKDLEKFNQKKTRDIGHCFLKLTDNIPKEIINAPINFCLDYYAEFCYEQDKKEDATTVESGKQQAATSKVCSVIEESVCDSKDQLKSVLADKS